MKKKPCCVRPDLYVPYECGDCGFTADETDFIPAADLSRRLAPGDIYTDLECPKCGKLAYPVEKVI